MKTRHKIAAGLAGVLAAATLTACDKFNEPFRDAPRTGYSDTGPATIIEMPDGFSNAATKCLTIDGRRVGIRVTSVYHGDKGYGAVSTVPDETCR